MSFSRDRKPCLPLPLHCSKCRSIIFCLSHWALWPERTSVVTPVLHILVLLLQQTSHLGSCHHWCMQAELHVHKSTLSSACNCRLNFIRIVCTGLIFTNVFMLGLNWISGQETISKCRRSLPTLSKTVAWKSHFETCSSIFFIISHSHSSQNASPSHLSPWICKSDKYTSPCLKPNCFVHRSKAQAVTGKQPSQCPWASEIKAVLLYTQ